MKIAIPDDYQDAVRGLDCFALLADHEVAVYSGIVASTDALVDQLKEAEALVLIRERTKITEQVLARLPKLRLISQTGKIAGHLDLEACTRHRVAVAEGVGSPIAPAELAWSLILQGKRQIPQAMEGMKQGRWQTNIGTALSGLVIGIWGYGKIGRRVAAYAKAFDMDVVVWGSEKARNSALDDGFRAAGSKEAFFATVDVLTLHLRLVSGTTHIVKAGDLALMKTDALLVNISRAELVEPHALIQALQAGRPGFAALDVFEDEPIVDPNHPLLQLPNVICTPHLGFVERKGYELYFSKAFENLLAFANGHPTNIANPDALLMA